ncbi:hypothetical protein MLD38_035538 [Melastoma candidum]|uniref:Uncharacterized protein n=1 Tax=Melastoma candidum TaxID=119954 RepID=A0ACB9LGX2_9MYRT|nr:hypothetical protein MLD38_035538 [Melastoma candidum]
MTLSNISCSCQQNVKLVRIEFWVDKIASGIHLQSNVLHTDNQIKRARCWFPCIDDNPQHCWYFDLEFTVAVDLVAVSPGKLLHQVNMLSIGKYARLSHYEEYLGAKFPYGTYKQVFIAPEMAVSSMSIGASMSIFSSDILYDEKIIDKTIDTRIKLARALARQWFGIYITSARPEDGELL